MNSSTSIPLGDMACREQQSVFAVTDAETWGKADHGKSS
jgi:hypothetical protein